MQIPPIFVILTWPTPNYVDPVTRGDALLVILIICSVLVTLAVAGRFYSRLVVKRWFGWDDGTMIIALIFAIGLNFVVLLANRKYGWDRHIWDLHVDMFQDASIVAWTAKQLFVGAATFTRISLICFYHRLVKDSGVCWFAMVLHASMFFVVALGVAFVCVGIWLCICLDEGTATLTIGVFNCVADLLTTILPIPMIWRLKMPMRDRIGVSALLGLGFFVTVAGVIRTYFIWKSLIDTWDQTWYAYPLWIFAAIEIDLAIICACAPALKPLMQGMPPITRLRTTKFSSWSTKSAFSSSANTTTTTATANSDPRGQNPHASRSHKFSSSSSILPRTLFRNTSEARQHHHQDSVWEGDEEYGMLRIDDDAHYQQQQQHQQFDQHSSQKSGRFPGGTSRTGTSPGTRGVRPGKGGGKASEETLVQSSSSSPPPPPSSSWSLTAAKRGGTTTTPASGLSAPAPPSLSSSRTEPMLEIVKRQTVDQEVSYLHDRGNR